MMIKNIFIIILKYLLIFIALFIILFALVFIIKIFSVLFIISGYHKITNVFWSIAIPAFYHTFFNSLIISIFVFDLMIYNNLRRNRFIAFFIPLIISSIFIYLVLFYLKPSYQDLNFNKVNDARLYFQKKVFFEYKDKKFFFNDIYQDNIKKIIILDDRKLNIVQSADVNFFEDQVTVNYIDNNNNARSIYFDKDQLGEYKSFSKFNRFNLLNLFESISYKFIFSSNIYINLFLWLSASFFLLSFTLIFKFKNYKFLTFIYNIIFLLFFYYGFIFIFDLYNKLFLNILSRSVLRDIFLALFLLFCSLILQSIRIVFLKKQDED
ncbi:MAG: hypothetical protein JXB50_03840 [Spirochaetes bacterium]|nr:hypothetical protein [Spirochaetota bacterium]